MCIRDRKKTTDNLKQELIAESNINSYLKKNQSYFIHCNVTNSLLKFFKKQNISKAELARRSNISEVYLHQLFSGRRKPSRDKLLCLCIGMELTIDETQLMLKEASYAQLYPRIKRDAIVYHGIIHHTSLDEINDKLFEENEKSLF